jgi:hypothetical protein
MQPDDPAALEGLCEWSVWTPFAVAVHTVPREPGVYVAREGRRGPIGYVGMVGERRGPASAAAFSV